ncbi:hypothetical protein GCM10019059_38060 [Camelimonas fluminis]|nr:hypothetical protein GCM10019059_38060 [Camelimonas fluminis]
MPLNCRALKRILGDADGATAVEFSLLLVPFLLLLLGGIGIGLSYWANVVFDSNVDIIAKAMYEEQPLCADGNANFPYTQACLRERICDVAPLVVISRAECKNRIFVDIRTMKGDGTDPALPAMVSGSGIVSAAFGQQFGVKPNVVVLVRAAISVPGWAWIVPQATQDGRNSILTAAQMFRVREQRTYVSPPTP